MTPAICIPKEGENHNPEGVSPGALCSDGSVGKDCRVKEVELVQPPGMGRKPPEAASAASRQGRCHFPRCADVVDSV